MCKLWQWWLRFSKNRSLFLLMLSIRQELPIKDTFLGLYWPLIISFMSLTLRGYMISVMNLRRYWWEMVWLNSYMIVKRYCLLWKEILKFSCQTYLIFKLFKGIWIKKETIIFNLKLPSKNFSAQFLHQWLHQSQSSHYCYQKFSNFTKTKRQ